MSIKFHPVSKGNPEREPKKRTGPPLANPGLGPKIGIYIRLDPDLVALYRKSGPGWQTRMNADLRKVNELEGGDDGSK